MINLKVTMNSEEGFKFKNFACDNVKDFIRHVLNRNQTALNWYEIIPGTIINVKNISSITTVDDDELNAPEEVVESEHSMIDGEEVILKEDLKNVEIFEDKSPLE